MNKYGAKKVSWSGRSFASKLEAAVYQVLMLQMKAGEISGIECQDSIYLTDARILYKPDFRVIAEGGEEYWVEAKGFKTPEWAIKKRLWKCYGPGRLQIYTGSHAHPVLSETIIPKRAA